MNRHVGSVINVHTTFHDFRFLASSPAFSDRRILFSELSTRSINAVHDILEGSLRFVTERDLLRRWILLRVRPVDIS